MYILNRKTHIFSSQIFRLSYITFLQCVSTTVEGYVKQPKDL